ncbi:amidase [Bordetella tumulicola]|uniref:amidase n=1 Tax=Bordetella tumulicola TaxID=1649133 RepID=UPI0039EE374E
MSSSPSFMTVKEIAAQLDAGSLSSAALVEHYLQRIAGQDSRFHAFTETYADEARQAAQSADLARSAGCRLGPLHGIPIALKDLIEIEGRITMGGSAANRERRSPVTATIVQRLRQQGVIILGKTHTVEFATGGWGTNTRLGTPLNPWDLDVPRTPGGSSSGSGVAVAAGLAPWAIGTDTGGSVRMPASWCNLTGLKVCTGRISTDGVLPLSTTLDTPGPMARTVGDTRLLYHALREPEPFDMHSASPARWSGRMTTRTDLAGLRLARLPQNERAVATPEVLAAYDASLDVLRAAGADIVDITLPYGFAEVAELNSLIMNTEGYSFYAQLLDDASQPLDEDVRPRLLKGREVRAADYLNALRRRQAMQQELYAIFEQVDALLTPTTATAPLPLTDVDQNATPAYYTRFANFFNLAALALPNGATQDGLPISLQIIGRPYSEEQMLDIGEAYQSRTQWHLRTPPEV